MSRGALGERALFLLLAFAFASRQSSCFAPPLSREIHGARAAQRCFSAGAGRREGLRGLRRGSGDGVVRERGLRVAMQSGETFRTEIRVPPVREGLALGDCVVLMGSCFSDNMARKLEERKFDVEANPFGVNYNPLSLAWGLDRLREGHAFSPSDITNGTRGLWFSYQHHTSFSSEDALEVLSTCNERLARAREKLHTAKFLFLTLGSAWAYVLTESGQVVANCHGMPQDRFERRMVSVEESVDALHASIQAWSEISPGLRTVITVSPVRHWKDGALENSVSKATLRLAAHQLNERMPKKVLYFPSYELVMDDLRDYRFYAPDMLHPSETAIDYIWAKVEGALIKPECLGTLQRVTAITRACQHRPFRPGSPAHQKFLRKVLDDIEALCAEHPNAVFDFGEERAFLQSMVIE